MKLRTELLKHIGDEYDSVIAADITDKNSGSKKVDNSLRESYKGLQLGTRTSTTIFLNSFSGGPEKGATISEVKRTSALLGIPSSVISEVVDLLKDKLFYIQDQANRILFTNKPNLNRMLLNKMENIDDKQVVKIEKDSLILLSKKGKLNIYIWITDSNDISDDIKLKLIILQNKDIKIMREIIENKGSLPRVYKNTIFFLTPIESKKPGLNLSIKRKLALEQIQSDALVKLNEEERKKIQESLKQEEENIKMKVNEIYRTINIPFIDEFYDIDLGIPTYGNVMNINNDVYDKLKSEDYIIEKIAPIVIREKYLKNKDYVSTKKIYDSSLKTLGESRLLNKIVLESSVKGGVKQGLFGLGIMEGEEIKPIYWKNKCSVGFSENEIIIDADLTEEFFKRKEEEIEAEKEKKLKEKHKVKSGKEENESKDTGKEEKKIVSKDTEKEVIVEETVSEINIAPFQIPKGKVSDLMGILIYIQSKFNDINIKIDASDGSIKKEEYEDKIKEALRQMGINVK